MLDNETRVHEGTQTSYLISEKGPKVHWCHGQEPKQLGRRVGANARVIDQSNGRTL
jgi:hypothetical protein